MAKNHIARLLHKRRLILFMQAVSACLTVGLVGVLGVRLLHIARAGTPFASMHVETGALAGNASKVADSASSTGYVIRFGVLTSPSPAPTPAPPQAPAVSVSAGSAAITAGQSTTISWSSSRATSCAASWTSSTAASGSQAVSPSATTTYTVTCTGAGGSANGSVTVTVSSPVAGACTTTLSGAGNGNFLPILSGTYHIQANEWSSSAPFAICTDGNADFKITKSSISQSGGPPGAYPSIYKGCHWGYCTTNSGLPVQTSKLIGTSGTVTTSYSTTLISSGAWDDSYDIWFNASSSTSNNSTGLEMMIWLNHLGSVQPAGSTVAKGVSIGGHTYNVWYGSSGGGTVSYVMTSPTNAVSNLDLGPLAADAVNRGYMKSTGYLIDVEAGFEPWQGGAGLSADSFSVTVH